MTQEDPTPQPNLLYLVGPIDIALNTFRENGYHLVTAEELGKICAEDIRYDQPIRYEPSIATCVEETVLFVPTRENRLRADAYVLDKTNMSAVNPPLEHTVYNAQRVSQDIAHQLLSTNPFLIPEDEQYGHQYDIKITEASSHPLLQHLFKSHLEAYIISIEDKANVVKVRLPYNWAAEIQEPHPYPYLIRLRLQENKINLAHGDETRKEFLGIR